MLGYIEDILDDFCDSRIRAMVSIGPSYKDLVRVPLIVGGTILMGMTLIAAVVVHADKNARKAEKIATQSVVSTNAVRAVQNQLER